MHRIIPESIRAYFTLFDDKADDETIDREIRSGVDMKGANIWVLMFAIFVASIGLNVNSTAVIIGAMLISPLMGPIMGIGYGIGIFDFALIRRSVRNLAIAVAIALATSTLYFWISPLTGAQSELLARTTPTIWDVLIALFGGLAGIVGTTRQVKSNIIPGVAIATALMPPLCTAGYGLADGHLTYFAGALYLFAINGVFIAFAAALITRIFHVREKPQANSQIARRIHLYVGTIVLVTMLPSLYLAYQMVHEEVFRNKASGFLTHNFTFKQAHIIDTRIDAKHKIIEVTLIGDPVSRAQISTIQSRMTDAGLTDAQLLVHQPKDLSADLAALKSKLSTQILTIEASESSAQNALQLQIQNELDRQNKQRQDFRDIVAELHTLIPALKNAWLSETFDWNSTSTHTAQQNANSPGQHIYIANIEVTKPLSREEHKTISNYLNQRLHAEVKTIISKAEK